MPVYKFNAFNRDYQDDKKWTPIDGIVRIDPDELVDGDWARGLIHMVYADDSQKQDPPYFHASIFHTDEDVTLDIAMHGSEFGYIVEGEMTYEIEGEEHVFRPGDLAYLDVKGKGIMKYKGPFTSIQVIFYNEREPARTDDVGPAAHQA